jgi:hemolysin-activating ACP:hemolysin acyltransferase
MAALRSQLRETFGKLVMAVMALPRYRHLSLADLQPVLLDPMIRDRLAIAQPRATDAGLADLAGFAIWASVSEAVDAKIREQIRAGVWPVRLAPEDWTSGEINWLLDVIAPDRKVAGLVLANFRQVVKGGELRLHPLVTQMVEPEVLEKLGAR